MALTEGAQFPMRQLLLAAATLFRLIAFLISWNGPQRFW